MATVDQLMNAPFRCPKCGSENTQRLKVVHAAGQTRTFGGGIATTGQVVAGLAQSSSALSRMASPPKYKGPDAGWIFTTGGARLWFAQGGCFVGLLAGGLLAVPLTVLSRSPDVGMLLIWVLGGGLALLGWSVGKSFWRRKHAQEIDRAQSEYERELRSWEMSQLCLRCGQLFEAESVEN